MYAIQLLKPETKEHYFASKEQYTICGDYENILNDDGLKLYHKALELVKQNKFKRYC